MSVSLLLIPLAIAIGGTASTTAAVSAGAAVALVGSKAVLGIAAEANLRHLKHLRELYEKSQSETLPPLETIFNDTELLKKTLAEYGLAVSMSSADQLICQIDNVQLVYSRKVAEEPFWLTIHGLQNVDELLTEMECLERDYRQNVQSYTYNKLMENLQKNQMQIAHETVLEDNSILLTIDI